MDGIGGGNEGKKRRLPSWMMGGVSSNLTGQENKDDSVGNIKPDSVGSEVSAPKVKTRSRKVVKKILRMDEETRVTGEVSAPKTKTRSQKIVNGSLDEDGEFHDAEKKGRRKRGQKGTLRADKEANTDNSRVLVKCATVKRSRTSNSEVEEGNENLDRIAAPRKKNKVSLNLNKSMPKAVSSSCTGRELLMEDLISIAQEYVKAESLTEQQNQKVGAEEKLSAAAPFDEPTNGAGTEPERMSSATELKYYLPSSSSDQVQSSSTFSNTGDAAQDMLNLLLGPLLTKPAENITSTTSLNRDDMLFIRPVRNQSQYHNAEESPPPEKKKTSLKDKVSMFLD